MDEALLRDALGRVVEGVRLEGEVDVDAVLGGVPGVDLDRVDRTDLEVRRFHADDVPGAHEARDVHQITNYYETGLDDAVDKNSNDHCPA